MSTSELDEATGEVVVLLDEAEALTLTAEIKAQASTLWLKLEQAYSGQAWRALKYKSWAAYLDAEFDISRSRGYQLISHAAAVRGLAGAAGVEVSTMVDTFGERETRGLDIDQVCEVVREVVMGLPKDATTATRLGLVEQIVIRLKPPVEPTKRTTTPKAKAPKPGDDLPPSDDPDLDARMDAAIANAQAKVEAEAAERAAAEAAKDSGADAPAAAPDAGQQDPPPADRHPSPGNDGPAVDPATGKPDEPHAVEAPGSAEGGTSDAEGVSGGEPTSTAPPALPDDWRDRLANATYLLGCPADQLAAVIEGDDLIDLYALFDHLGQILTAHQEQNA